MSTDNSPLHAFEGFGIEVEYMIVARRSLDVAPLSDRLIHDVVGGYVTDVDRGELAWSNELVLHVLEIKTNGPAAGLEALPALFQREVRRINRLLSRHGAALMPGAAHPWMDPLTETRLWPHAYDVVYEAYDRIFGCRGHGWSNLQSVHVNLPFADDAEFDRLHSAIRLVLPLLPGLAASSPFLEGRFTGMMDARLEAYRNNARQIPRITGAVIPEPVSTRAAYEAQILAPMYRDIAQHDPDGVLQHEWLHSRGAIARFDRHAIEIRLLDVQEAPVADLAIAAAVVGLVRALYEGGPSDAAAQRAVDTRALARILLAAIREGERAVVDEPALLRCLGLSPTPLTLQALWGALLERLIVLPEGPWQAPLSLILEQGPLARRLLAATGEAPTRTRLRAIYRELCACLQHGELFDPEN
jgi:glutamate---cysteine ligase / carboxylate-amine ligase